MKVLAEKCKEVLFSVLPIIIIVLILNFTIAPLPSGLVIRFIIGAFLVIIGLTVFLTGVDVGITPIGNLMGSKVAKTNKVRIVIVAGLLLGFFVSIAEPDLQILAGQVADVTGGVVGKTLIVVLVSLGIAVMLTLGLLRIVYNVSLPILLFILYGVILLLSFFTTPEFLAISFDASGATTGALTVPFILALAAGVSKLKKDTFSSETDSFGLVAIASTGAILAVMIMSLFTGNNEIVGQNVSETAEELTVIGTFLTRLPTIAGEVLLALAPILLLFSISQKILLKLSKKSFRKILFGMTFTFAGLVLFLLGVNCGFMEVGRTIGLKLASLEHQSITVGVGLVLGMVTILAEPAVYVLTHQIEDVTGGYVKRKSVLITLAVGVSLAVGLSILRILVPQIKLWHYLLPGYLIAVVLMFIVPKLFVGIAFDSGGVASGPMTATFVLAFAQGVAEATEGANVLIDGFGIIAMVAMTPLITLQLLGLIFKLRTTAEQRGRRMQ